jgi:putative IMPACT (imprinted ancient) family translation regulator
VSFDWQDDKEYGAGRRLKNLLQSDSHENIIVFVNRFYGGKHLGAQRYLLYANAAKAALSTLKACKA